MIRFIRFVLGFGVVLSITALGTGFLGAIHPAFDTASHMRLHLTVGMIILAGLTFIFSLKRIAMICFLCALAGGFTTLDSIRILAKTETALPEKPIYLHFHMNLLWKNADKESVVRKIMEIDPLLISVTEVSRRWNRVLKPLDERWKHSASCPEFGIRGGTRIYSKLPLDRENEFCGPYGTFIMSHMVLDDGRRVAVGSVHPRWPWPASGPSHYKAFEPALANIGTDALISGDFNAVPWSYSVTRFAEI